MHVTLAMQQLNLNLCEYVSVSFRKVDARMEMKIGEEKMCDGER